MFVFALAYLAFPVFVILFTFFSLPFMLLSALALVTLIFYLHRTYQLGNHLPLKALLLNYWPLLLISLLVSYLCVYPFDAIDWRNYMAAFNLLEESYWPPVYELDGQTWFLRYYLAWFIPPALLAKILGQQTLMVGMFIWTAVGLIMTMLLAFRNLHKKHLLIIASLVFFLFSGLDLVGAWFYNFIPPLGPYWLNWWGGYRVLEIFANLNAFGYSPHHAIGTFLPTCLFLFARHAAVQYGALILVINTMWSTFGTVGIIPIVAWALYKEGIRTALTPQNLLAAPLLAIPIVLYLTHGTGHVPFMFIWEHENFSFSRLIMFCILEFWLILGLLYWFQKEDRSLIVTLVVFLTALCMIKVGGWNNLLYRGAMPAVCVMALLTFKAILANKGWRKEILIAYLCIGAIPVIAALVKRISTPRVDSNVTFQQYYDGRPAHFRDAERWQYLVKTDYARHVFNVPLLRGISNSSQGGR